MEIEVEHLLAVNNQLGEGPLWQPLEQALYWVDIPAQTVHRWFPNTGQHEVFDFDIPITALGRRSQGGFITATRDGFAFWNPSDMTLQFLSDPEADKPQARFNDGAVGPDGCFWAGTMTRDDASSSLYRFGSDGHTQRMVMGVTVANGIGWSPDGKTMYFIADYHWVVLISLYILLIRDHFRISRTLKKREAACRREFREEHKKALQEIPHMSHARKIHVLRTIENTEKFVKMYPWKPDKEVMNKLMELKSKLKESLKEGGNYGH